MSKFFMLFSSKLKGHALDGEEYVEKGNHLVYWNMPIVETGKIYKRKPFTLSTDPSIKTVETKFTFGKNGGYIRLFDQNPFDVNPPSYIKEKFYNQLNVGLVQIRVKTVTRKIPSTASIILCVRDNRIEKVEDSIVGMVESRLSDGPFYFNIFPNINMSLSDSFLLEILSLNILIKGFEELPPGSEPFLLTYRTCYKLNLNSFGQEALIESPTGKTVFFQTQIESSNDVVQKVTKWDQVQLPQDWPPRLKKKIHKVIEDGENGTVNVTFEYVYYPSEG